MTDQTTDQPTDQAAPIGYAVVEEREGDYAPPLTRDTFLIGDAEPVTRRTMTTDDARFYAGARVTTYEAAAEIRAGRNHRDAETVVTWHIVALVPVTGPIGDPGCSCGEADRGAPGHDGH